MKTALATLVLLTTSATGFGDSTHSTPTDPEATTNLRKDKIADDTLLDIEEPLFYIAPDVLTEIQKVPESVVLSRDILGDYAVPSTTVAASDTTGLEAKEKQIENVFLQSVGCTDKKTKTNFMCQTLTDDTTMLCSSVIEGKTNYLMDADMVQTVEGLPTFIPLAADVTIGAYAATICEMSCDGETIAHCNSAVEPVGTDTGISGMKTMFDEDITDVLTSSLDGGEFDFESDPRWTANYACQPYRYNLFYIPEGTNTLTKASLSDGVNFLCQPETSITAVDSLPLNADLETTDDSPLQTEEYVLNIVFEMH